MPDIANPVQNVTFASNGDEAYGYLSLPESGSGPGLIVIQEWWGLTTHMAQMADRFAAEGYVALAPDLYGGATTHDEAEALQLLLEIPVDKAARDLRGAVDYLLSRDEVVGETIGVVGGPSDAMRIGELPILEARRTICGARPCLDICDGRTPRYFVSRGPTTDEPA